MSITSEGAAGAQELNIQKTSAGASLSVTPNANGDQNQQQLNQQQAQAAQEQVTVPKSYLSEVFSNGLKESESRLMEKLKKLGYSGEASKIEDAIQELLSPKSAKKGKDGSSNNASKDEVTSEELETLRLQVEKYQSDALKAEENRQSYVSDNAITAAMADKNLIDGVLPKAKNLFNLDYTIKQTDEGEIRVYKKNGELVRNDRMTPATVSEVVQAFLKDNDYLVKSTAKGASTQKQAMEGDLSYRLKNGTPQERMKAARELFQKK